MGMMIFADGVKYYVLKISIDTVYNIMDTLSGDYINIEICKQEPERKKVLRYV